MPRKTTRNANNTGNIRQRPDGRWEARYSVTLPDGRTSRKSIYGVSQSDVRKKLTETLHSIDKGTYLEPQKVTTEQWLTTWLNEFAKPATAPLTFASYTRIIDNHVLPYIGKRPLQSLRGIDVQKIYNAMQKKGLSTKTIKNVSAVLHKAFTVAGKQGLIALNPVDAAELPRSKAPEIKPLSESDIPLFINAIADSTFQNAFALCLFAGLREAECLGLSWENVDLENRTITISQQLQKMKPSGEYIITKSTKNVRIVLLHYPLWRFKLLQQRN